MSRTLTRLAVGAIALAALTTACSPVLTQKPYSASDGVRVVWEEGAPVHAVNVLVLANEQGADARVVGGLVNAGTDDVEITLGFAGGSSEVVTVPGGTTYLLDGSEDRDVVLSDIPVGPGATVEMEFSTPSQGVVPLQVPVLDGTLSEYAALVP